MLNDKHFKGLKYSKIKRSFPNTDIKGGVAIHYRDTTQNFGPTLFTAHILKFLSLVKKG